MSAEMLAYPFLFVAIFFQSFILVTFLSRPARAARARGRSPQTPRVAIIVPCWNEAETVGGTAASLLALEYPQDKLEIILVDDGSTDETRAVMERYRGEPQVKIIYKENGGKHTALNAGIAATSAEIVGCLDADSFVEPEALKEIIPSFTDEKVAATTAAMSVHKPETILQHMQNAEYIFGIALRHTLSSINGIYVTPGPFSFYRRAIVDKLGGFREGHKTEDMEMALRLQHAGYKIENAPRARVYTKAPRSIPALLKQRTRWTTGFLRNIIYDYRDMLGNIRYGALGTIVLPFGFIAIASGILVFLSASFSLIRHTIETYQIRAGIPFAYSYMPSFDWFYFPTTAYLFLALITISIAVTMIALGKQMSGTPGSLVRGLLSYVFVYGLVVPFWLMRAVADVALGRDRVWR